MKKKTLVIVIAIIVIAALAFSIYKFTGGAVYTGGVKNCNDTDGGKNYFVKGITTYSNRASGYVDTCSSAYGLSEYFCEYDRIKRDTTRCDKGCVNGACIK